MEGKKNEMEYGRNSGERKRKGEKGVDKIWENGSRGKMMEMGLGEREFDRWRRKNMEGTRGSTGNGTRE